MCQRFCPLIVNARLAHFVLPGVTPATSLIALAAAAFVPVSSVVISSRVISSFIVPSVVAVH